MEQIRKKVSGSGLSNQELHDLFLNKSGKTKSHWMSEWKCLFDVTQMSNENKLHLYKNIAALLGLMYSPTLRKGAMPPDFPWKLAKKIVHHLSTTYKQNRSSQYTPKEKIIARLVDLLISKAVHNPNKKKHIIDELNIVLKNLPPNVAYDVLLHCYRIVVPKLREPSIIQALLPGVITSASRVCTPRVYIKVAILWKIAAGSEPSLSKLWKDLPLQPKELPKWLEKRQQENVFTSKKTLKKTSDHAIFTTVFLTLYELSNDRKQPPENVTKSIIMNESELKNGHGERVERQNDVIHSIKGTTELSQRGTKRTLSSVTEDLPKKSKRDDESKQTEEAVEVNAENDQECQSISQQLKELKETLLMKEKIYVSKVAELSEAVKNNEALIKDCLNKPNHVPNNVSNEENRRASLNASNNSIEHSLCETVSQAAQDFSEARNLDRTTVGFEDLLCKKMDEIRDLLNPILEYIHDLKSSPIQKTVCATQTEPFSPLNPRKSISCGTSPGITEQNGAVIASNGLVETRNIRLPTQENLSDSPCSTSESVSLLLNENSNQSSVEDVADLASPSLNVDLEVTEITPKQSKVQGIKKNNVQSPMVIDMPEQNIPQPSEQDIIDVADSDEELPGNTLLSPQNLKKSIPTPTKTTSSPLKTPMKITSKERRPSETVQMQNVDEELEFFVGGRTPSSQTSSPTKSKSPRKKFVGLPSSFEYNSVHDTDDSNISPGNVQTAPSPEKMLQDEQLSDDSSNIDPIDHDSVDTEILCTSPNVSGPCPSSDVGNISSITEKPDSPSFFHESPSSRQSPDISETPQSPPILESSKSPAKILRKTRNSQSPTIPRSSLALQSPNVQSPSSSVSLKKTRNSFSPKTPTKGRVLQSVTGSVEPNESLPVSPALKGSRSITNTPENCKSSSPKSITPQRSDEVPVFATPQRSSHKNSPKKNSNNPQESTNIEISGSGAYEKTSMEDSNGTQDSSVSSPKSLTPPVVRGVSSGSDSSDSIRSTRSRSSVAASGTPTRRSQRFKATEKTEEPALRRTLRSRASKTNK